MKKTALFVVVLVAVLSFAPRVLALTGRTLLGFCQTYVAPDGSNRTHRGIDVAVDDGRVLAPVAGRVRFAGRVPGPHGGSVLAVTLEAEEGVVTLLPFANVAVEAGQDLAAGALVGDVAATGDPSSPEPHLHMGLKREGVYVDPVVLLAVPAPAPTTALEPEPADVVESQSPKVRTTPVTAADQSTEPVPNGVQAMPAGSGAVQQAQVAAARPAIAGTSIAPGVSIAPAAQPAATPLFAPAVSPVALADEGRSGAGSALRMPVALARPGNLAVSVAVFATAMLLSVMLFVRRSFTRQIADGVVVSGRLGTLLQHLKAGDTLCGLTSCPGPLPSQSRGH